MIVLGIVVVTGLAIVVLFLMTAFRLMILGWPMTVNTGPHADVAQINDMMRTDFGRLVGNTTQIFTVADGDYAVNASNLGEGWRERAFVRKAGAWTSLHLFVNTDACSLGRAGFPADVALRIAQNFKGRMLDPFADTEQCFVQHESIETNQGSASDVEAVRTLELAAHRGYEDADCCMFAVVDGDFAVTSAFIGDGWHERLYQKGDRSWESRHIDVLTSSCSLRSAGVPATVADRFERDFRTRYLYEAGHRTGCWTHPDSLRSTL